MQSQKSQGDRSRMVGMLSYYTCLFLALFSVRFAKASYEYKAIYHIEHNEETYSLNLPFPAEDELQSMRLVFVSTDDPDEHGITESTEAAEAVEDEEGVSINPAESALSLSSGTLYKLELVEDTWLSIFNVRFPAEGYYALFAQHSPSEYYEEGSNALEFLYDEEGHAIPPEYIEGETETSEHDEDDEPWGNTILGCGIVWMVTFTGIAILAFGSDQAESFTKEYLFMFASGILLKHQIVNFFHLPCFHNCYNILLFRYASLHSLCTSSLRSKCYG